MSCYCCCHGKFLVLSGIFSSFVFFENLAARRRWWGSSKTFPPPWSGCTPPPNCWVSPRSALLRGSEVVLQGRKSSHSLPATSSCQGVHQTPLLSTTLTSNLLNTIISHLIRVSPSAWEEGGVGADGRRDRSRWRRCRGRGGRGKALYWGREACQNLSSRAGPGKIGWEVETGIWEER